MPRGRLSERSILARQKEAKAVKLRLGGATFEEIAAQVGYSTRSGAYGAVKRAMDHLAPVQEVKELRELTYRRSAFVATRKDRPSKAYQKSSIPGELRWQVWQRDDFTCKHCGTRKNLEIDHIVPESKGGSMTVENCQTLCRSCNRSKGAKMPFTARLNLDLPEVPRDPQLSFYEVEE